MQQVDTQQAAQAMGGNDTGNVAPVGCSDLVRCRVFQNASEIREALTEIGWDCSDCSNEELWMYNLIVSRGSYFMDGCINGLPWKGFRLKEAVSSRVTLDHMNRNRTPERARAYAPLQVRRCVELGAHQTEGEWLQGFARIGIPQNDPCLPALLQLASTPAQGLEKIQYLVCRVPDEPFECRFPSCACLDLPNP